MAYAYLMMANPMMAYQVMVYLVMAYHMIPPSIPSPADVLGRPSLYVTKRFLGGGGHAGGVGQRTSQESGFGDGTGTNVLFHKPMSLALKVDGSLLFVGEDNNYKIRQIDTALKASLAVDNAQYYMYVADKTNHKIRRIKLSDGVTSTLSGGGPEPEGNEDGSADGTGTMAYFNNPSRVVTVAGGGHSGNYADDVGGTGTAAGFRYPVAIAIFENTMIYVADYENHKIKSITISSPFSSVHGLTLDPSGGLLYIADTDNALLRVLNTDPAQSSYRQVLTVAGGLYPKNVDGQYVGGDGCASCGNEDGVGSKAAFNHPWGIFMQTSGTIYVADSENHAIREVNITAGAPSAVCIIYCGF
eukprot:gene12692-15003_t